MGVDLRLLPIECEHENLWYSHSMLSLERRRELWPLFAELEKTSGVVDPSFTSFCGRQDNGENGYGKTLETPYGQPLTYLTAEQILTLKDHEAVQDNTTNRAIWAYLAHLNPKMKIALYWH